MITCHKLIRFFAVGKRPLIKSKKQEILVDDVTAINLDIGTNLTLVAGSSVNVICEVDAVPEAAITWQQNGDQVFNSLNKTSLIVEDPGQVKLQTVSCKADNVLGFDSKASYFKILGRKMLRFHSFKHDDSA